MALGRSRFLPFCLAVLTLTCSLAVGAREVALGGDSEAAQWRAGMRRLTQDGTQGQIAEWVDAPCGRFPYMASLRTMTGEHQCGGVLVDKKWVLTAAHCVDNSTALYPSHAVLLGLCNGDEDKGTEASGRVVELFMGEKIVIHPNYTGTTQEGNDIALILLNRESKNVPVNLATNPNELVNKRKVAAVGFGTSNVGGPSDTLKFTNELSIVPNSVCELSWEGVIQDAMVCAIGPDGVLDMCPGDSGGPLLLPFQPGGKVEDGAPEVDKVVGVTSFGGKRACGEAGGPAVYTRVTSYADWIASVLETTKDNTCTCVCPSDETQEPEAPNGAVVPEEPEQPASLAAGPASLAAGPASLAAGPASLAAGPALAPAGTEEPVQLEESADPAAGSPGSSPNCVCSEDGVSAGVQTGFGGCTRRLEAGAALCYVQPNQGDCPIARNSSLFPGALWISCEDRPGQGPPVVQKIPKDEARDSAQVNKALQDAASRGQEAKTRVALLAGANPETPFRNVPILHTVASMDYVAVGTALIEAGVNVDSKDTMDGSTSLHKASGWGNIDFVALLISAGANSTIRNNDGRTARSMACEFNMANPKCPGAEIVQLLDAL